MQEPSRTITLVGGEKVYPLKALDTFHLANMREQSALAFIYVLTRVSFSPRSLPPRSQAVPALVLILCNHLGQ